MLKLKSQKLELIDVDRITGIPVYAHENVQKTLEDLNWPICIDYRDLLARTNDASDRVPALLF